MLIDTKAIKARREALLLTMQEAAVRAGMRSKSNWNQIENGFVSDPRCSTLYSMAQALDCTMEDLLIKRRPKTTRAK